MIVITCLCKGELTVIGKELTCKDCGLIPDMQDLKWREVEDESL